jgi:hypothetical protein
MGLNVLISKFAATTALLSRSRCVFLGWQASSRMDYGRCCYATLARDDYCAEFDRPSEYNIGRRSEPSAGLAIVPRRVDQARQACMAVAGERGSDRGGAKVVGGLDQPA